MTNDQLLARCIQAETKCIAMTMTRLARSAPDGGATTRVYAAIARAIDAGLITERRGELRVTDKGYERAGVTKPLWLAA